MEDLVKLLEEEYEINTFLIRVGIAIGIFIIAALISAIVRKVLSRAIRKSNETLKNDPTRFKFLKNAVPASIFGLAAMLAIYIFPQGKALAVSLFAGAGIFAAIVGFASQAAFSNIISGIFIIFFKPFRVHDQITIGTEISGVVEDITLRHTVIRDFQNRRIIIPNSVISNESILNATIGDEKICRHTYFSISYDSDIDLARKIIQEETMAHPLWIDNREPDQILSDDPPVRVAVMELGEYFIKLRAWVWAANPSDSFMIFIETNESIKKRFDKEGIEIPFPYRTVVYKKDMPKNRD
ncbi:MAG: mechanosensitive ion channel family protein [Bacteroidia bacterium]|nr:mechanosensitive ion channel family protein [Bacteroidia bacterium]